MDEQTERAILLDGLGQAGAAGGGAGGFLGGGLPGGIGAACGRAGARWAGRRLPEDVHETAVPLPGAVTDPFGLAARAFADERAQVVEATTDSLSAVMGTGFGGLNPAVVTVRYREQVDGRAVLQVRGVAKEGLVKQRGGQRAAERLAARLLQLLTGTGEEPGTGHGLR